MKEAVVIVFGFIIGLVHYNKFEDHMVSHLYKVDNRRSKLDNSKNSDDDLNLTINEDDKRSLHPDRTNCCRKRLLDWGWIGN